MNDQSVHPPQASVVLEATDVCKTYRLGRVDVPVLKNAGIEVREREWVAILGASGSGKSTLLHLLGGLDRPDPQSGPVRFRNKDVSKLRGGGMDRYRNRDVGFVFQFYHLLPELTVLENALLSTLVPRRPATALAPLLAAGFGMLAGAVGGWFFGPSVLPAADAMTEVRLWVLLLTWAVVGAAIGMALFQIFAVPTQAARIRGGEDAEATRRILTEFGLGERLRHRSTELSGGERQRTAIARALANDPKVLLADEPTGNLDAATGREILDLLKRRHEDGLTIVMVTHDPAVADYADRVVRLKDGQVIQEDA